MGLIPLGILSSAGGGFGTYELIETQILGTTAASITLSSLDAYAGIYKHLQVRITSRDNRATDGGNNVLVRLNGDTGGNYAWHRLRGNGSSVTSSAGSSATSMNLFASQALNDTASSFGAAVLDLLDPYSTSKNKTLRCLQGIRAATDPAIELRSGFWNNTASITSITFTPETSGSFVTGSRFSIYGIR
jgi:hypothetical protein